MTYDPAKDLASCNEGTVVATIRAATVAGFFIEQDQLILDGEGGRFQAAGSHATFDYPTHLLPFKPRSTDVLVIGSKQYAVDRALVVGGGLFTKLLLGASQDV